MPVEIENLYATILDLHYIRNALFDHQNLERSADYIEQKFKQYGLKVESQTFKVDGLDYDFRNVIATWNPGKTNELLITSHYDHIFNSVGADDNLSGVSVMLEVARLVKELNINLTVKFISFTLEEGHSGYIKMLSDKGKQLGLLTSDGFPANYNARNFFRKVQSEFLNSVTKGETYVSALDTIVKNQSGAFTKEELEYLQLRKEIYDKVGSKGYQSFMGLVGSAYYVEKSKDHASNILGVINVETCGFVSNEKGSQKLIPGLDPTIFPMNDIKDISVGNFILIIADKYSTKLGSVFFEMTKEVVPSLLLAVPLDYDEISKSARDLLRSDHAPFWKEQIPALMITDTANFRNPYYHTPGDTIETIDFEFLANVAKTVLKTVQEFSKD